MPLDPGLPHTPPLYVQRKTRSGREFTGVSACATSVDPRVKQAVAMPLPQPLEEIPSLSYIPEPPLSKRPLSPVSAHGDDVNANLPVKKKRRGHVQGPRRESRRSTTNGGVHRRNAAKRNEGGHGCTQQDRRAVIAMGSPFYTGFDYSGLKVQTNGYGGIHLGLKARDFPHGTLEEILSHGYTLISWDGTSLLLELFFQYCLIPVP